MISVLLSTHADTQGVDISFTVFVFFVCTLTKFSGEDKASGVKYCTLVDRRPGQGISHLGEPFSPFRRSNPNKTFFWGRKYRRRIDRAGTATVIITLEMRYS